jgi:phage-related protein
MPIFEGTWKVMKKVGEFVNENRKEFIFLASVVAGALVAFKTFVAFKQLITFIKGIKASIIAMNAAMAANPIGIVVVALGALVAALVYAYTESEAFRGFIDKLFAFIKDTFEPVFWILIDTVKVVFEAIVMQAELLWTKSN